MSINRNFYQLAESLWASNRSLCIGLDPNPDKIPLCVRTREDMEQTIVDFLFPIIDATCEYAAAYKPNFAFYKALRIPGIQALMRVMDHINRVAPDVPIILDGKDGDIGATSEKYAAANFDWLGADAITIQPYLGQTAVQPLLDRKDKGLIVLCKTTNPGSDEFQNLPVSNDIPLYQIVADNVAKKWNGNNNCGVVVGAVGETAGEELAATRELIGDGMGMLIPGLGTQGGDVDAVKENAGRNIWVNSSSGIIHASFGTDFAEAAAKAAQDLHEQLIR